MPAKIYDSESTENVTFRIETRTLKRLDEYWRLNLYRDRTEIIRIALKNMIDGIRCPNCGAINPKGGHICSVCLRSLDEHDPISDILTLFSQNKDLVKAIKDNEQKE